MTIAASVQHYLGYEGVRYDVITHERTGSPPTSDFLLLMAHTPRGEISHHVMS